MKVSRRGSQMARVGVGFPSARRASRNWRNATAFFSAAGPFIGLPVIMSLALSVQMPWPLWHPVQRPHTTPLW